MHLKRDSIWEREREGDADDKEEENQIFLFWHPHCLGKQVDHLFLYLSRFHFLDIDVCFLNGEHLVSKGHFHRFSKSIKNLCFFYTEDILFSPNATSLLIFLGGENNWQKEIDFQSSTPSRDNAELWKTTSNGRVEYIHRLILDK